jgi:hypothetical protein
MDIVIVHLHTMSKSILVNVMMIKELIDGYGKPKSFGCEVRFI